MYDQMCTVVLSGVRYLISAKACWTDATVSATARAFYDLAADPAVLSRSSMARRVLRFDGDALARRNAAQVLEGAL
jgi:hypothetical protein